MTFRRANTATCARASARRSVWLALGLSSLALPASAHQGHRSYCSARTQPGGLDVTIQIPLQLLAENADGTRGPSDEPAMLAAAPRLRQELEAHVRATTPAGECTLDSSGPRFEGQAERRAVFELTFSCPPGAITLGSDYRRDVDPGAEMVCAIDGSAHVFRQGAADRLVGTPPSLLRVLADFVRLGAEHVLGGIDHVLFVLSLLLGAVSAARSDTRRALGRVALLVSGFTLGHSLTLIVAALGILALPIRLTESLIALSIVVVAVHNLLDENPRGRALTSALFGLIHGFGFASALSEVGLPRRGTVAALLAFNLGIELAQLGLVLGCFPLLVWARQKPWFRMRLLVPACAIIAGLGILWLIKRAFALDLLPWLGS